MMEQGTTGLPEEMAPAPAERPVRNRRQKVAKAIGHVVAFAAVAAPASATFFTHNSETVQIAGHEVAAQPTFDGFVTVDSGALSISARIPIDSPYDAGMHIDVERAVAPSYDELLQRYALIASQPEGEIATAEEAWRDMAYESLAAGAAVGVVPLVIWNLVGAKRRKELTENLAHSNTKQRVGLAVGATLAAGAVSGLAMIEHQTEYSPEPRSWASLTERFPQIPNDPMLEKVQISDGLLSKGAEKLFTSAINTYEDSQTFYHNLAAAVDEVAPDIRQPIETETVALLVSDRHDNIGMDPVARLLGDAGGASILIDAGDDTSTGKEWEQFSLNSVNQAFKGYDKISAAGNHDNGDVVYRYFKDKGWTVLTGKPVTVDNIRFLGNRDPRSSGLGHWRTAKQGTIPELSASLATTACEADDQGEPISTLVTHDRNAARDALTAGCVDLALSGHLHSQAGPTEVIGANGETGTTYTNGTTGGAAYAFALGSKLRRNAELTLITYEDGAPVGMQPIKISTGGTITVKPYYELSAGDGVEVDENNSRTSGATQ